MALQKLIEGDCGGNNSLVQFSSIVSRDGAGSSSAQGHSRQLVHEFLSQAQPPPQTFNMNTLLSSVNNIDPGNTSRVPKYDNRLQSIAHQPSAIPFFNPPMPLQMGFPIQAPFMHQMNMQPSFASTSSNVQLQYLDDSPMSISELKPGRLNDVQKSAQKLVNSVNDDEVAYSQFVSFMKKISSGEVSLSMPGEEEEVKRLSKNEQIDQMAEKYKEEWSKLSDVPPYTWQEQSKEQVNPFTEYEYAAENNFMDNVNSLEMGKIKLKAGDIAGAVLCFEAAVKQKPDLVEGWLLLGITQAENEKDPLAIAALTKCLDLDPGCLDAYMTLAAAYANESYPVLAYNALNNWLKSNPLYRDLMSGDTDVSKMSENDLKIFTEVNLIKAAQLSPSNVDPEVQNALGVLFNISHDYDKAVDCYKTALMAKGEDPKLWNRLGATLANGERPEEAVDAYRRALNLEPGFIRARYNMGITCMNLGAYKEAAEHFLVALNQQVKAQEIENSEATSSTIWSTLRMVCAFMGEYEVTPLIDQRNLSDLNRHFGI